MSYCFAWLSHTAMSVSPRPHGASHDVVCVATWLVMGVARFCIGLIYLLVGWCHMRHWQCHMALERVSHGCSWISHAVLFGAACLPVGVTWRFIACYMTLHGCHVRARLKGVTCILMGVTSMRVGPTRTYVACYHWCMNVIWLAMGVT